MTKIIDLQTLLKRTNKEAGKLRAEKKKKKIMATTTFTRSSISKVKEQLAFPEDKIPTGPLIRDHIKGTVVSERCGRCKKVDKRVINIQLFWRTKSGELRTENPKGQIKSWSELQFNKSLPVKLKYTEVHSIPACVDCLTFLSTIDENHEQKTTH